jgi:hypothetical protein
LTDVFQNLTKITAAAYSTAGFSLEPKEWKFLYADDAVKQRNGFDCGLHVVFSTRSLLNKKSLTHFIPSDSNKSRAWMKTLISGDGSFSGTLATSGSHYLPYPQSPNVKPSPKTAQQMARRVRVVEEFDITAVNASVGPLVRRELKKEENWTECEATNCVAEPKENLNQNMCIRCRKVYHEACESFRCCDGRCSYLICEDCSKYDERNER